MVIEIVAGDACPCSERVESGCGCCCEPDGIGEAASRLLAAGREYARACLAHREAVGAERFGAAETRGLAAQALREAACGLGGSGHAHAAAIAAAEREARP